MNTGGIKQGMLRYVSTIALMLVTVLTTAAALPSSYPAPLQGADIGQDCTQDSSICRRGLLCLSSSDRSAGDRRVCRRPKESEVCDRAAACDNSSPNITLACRQIVTSDRRSDTAKYLTQICVQVFGRGHPCNANYHQCRPGLTCGQTGFQTGFPTGFQTNVFTGVCVTVPQATLGQDCSRTDCGPDLFCKTNSDGSTRCVNPIQEGQPCNPTDFGGAVNPCSNSNPLACFNGKCGRGIPLGSPCTIQDDISRPSSTVQCASDFPDFPNNVPLCLKSEAGPLKCLARLPGDACGDSINGGCFTPDTKCIRGYCGVPNGGQGDICGPSSACRPGLRCLNSTLEGAGARCTLQRDAGYSCDEFYQSFTSCKDGLKCIDVDGNIAKVCQRKPVPIGENCIEGETPCAEGLTCISKTVNRLYPSEEGVCVHVSSAGDICNASKFQICHANYFDSLAWELPPLECVKGRCVNSTTASWGDRCDPGPRANAKCAARDAIAKLECQDTLCVHTNLTLGMPCSLPNMFFPDTQDSCSAGFECYAVYHARPKAEVDYDFLKCVHLAQDGERCDYNRFMGCQNINSSCVRGVCTSS